jgi:hypothetical protein
LKKRKFSKNIARCIESNGVKTFQKLVHLVFFCGVLEVQPTNSSPFSFLVELRMHANYTKRTNI